MPEISWRAEIRCKSFLKEVAHGGLCRLSKGIFSSRIVSTAKICWTLRTWCSARVDHTELFCCVPVLASHKSKHFSHLRKLSSWHELVSAKQQSFSPLLFFSEKHHCYWNNYLFLKLKRKQEPNKAEILFSILSSPLARNKSENKMQQHC